LPVIRSMRVPFREKQPSATFVPVPGEHVMPPAHRIDLDQVTPERIPDRKGDGKKHGSLARIPVSGEKGARIAPHGVKGSPCVAAARW
jgi:hypothetical protein